MNISGRGHACLTVEPPGELVAVAEEKLELETRGLERYKVTTMRSGVGRSQNDDAWLGWVFPVEEDHKAQAKLKRLGPHHGGIQMQMRCTVHSAKVRETAQRLEVDLAVICAPCPAALRGRTSVAKPTVRLAPPCGERVQRKADDFRKLFLRRLIAVHALIAKARW
jgi:hypothetical protein